MKPDLWIQASFHFPPSSINEEATINTLRYHTDLKLKLQNEWSVPQKKEREQIPKGIINPKTEDCSFHSSRIPDHPPSSQGKMLNKDHHHHSLSLTPLHPTPSPPHKSLSPRDETGMNQESLYVRC